MDNMATPNEVRPDSMDDISLGFCGIVPKVRVAALGTLADLPTRDGCRAGDIEGELEIRSEVGTDGVRLRMIRARGAFVRDGEFISLAGSLVQARRGGDKIGNIYGFPNQLLCSRIKQLEGELNSRIPYAEVES